MLRSLFLFFAFLIGLEVGYSFSYELFDTEEIPLREDPYFLSTDQFNNLFVIPYLVIVFLNIPATIYTVKGNLVLVILGIGIIGLASNLLTGLFLDWRFSGYLPALYAIRSLSAIGYECQCVATYFLAMRYGKKSYEEIIGAISFFSLAVTALSFYLTSKTYLVTGSIPDTWYFASLLSAASLLCGFGCIAVYCKWEKEKRRALENE